MSKLALFTFVSALSLAACGGKPEGAKDPSGQAALPAGTVAPGDAKIGDKSVCPVSGETFTITAESPSAQHDGKTYYFCCAGCKDKFMADPATHKAKWRHLQSKSTIGT